DIFQSVETDPEHARNVSLAYSMSAKRKIFARSTITTSSGLFNWVVFYDSHFLLHQKIWNEDSRSQIHFHSDGLYQLSEPEGLAKQRHDWNLRLDFDYQTINHTLQRENEVG